MTNDFDFEFLTPFVGDEFMTDINFNGKTLWVDHLKKGRFCVELDVTEYDIENFCYRFANYSNKQFNNTYPILESETDDLRISILHKSIAKSGYSISVRKTPAIVRLTDESLVETNYASQELLDYLKTIVQERKNIIISGLPGVGKTELLKYLTKYISENERVITIEDNLEIRYPMIHPQKDGLMVQVNSIIDYRAAIKASLRQRVDWILLSEVRGDEVVELLQAVSTGATLMSTIHADNAFQIPKRILHMFPGNEITNEKLLYNIHENIDYGISIKSKINETGIQRYIFEVVKYTIDNLEYSSKLIYSHSKGFIKE